MNSYSTVVLKAMIMEGESDLFHKEKDGKKRKVETQDGGSKKGNFQGHVNKKTEFRSDKNVGFKRFQSGNGGQGSRFPNPNQQKLNRSP